jgi:hypothetical protein
MSEFTREYVKNDKNVEIFTIDDFLKEEECDYLCTQIERRSVRSTVAGYGNETSVESEARTSFTSTLSDTDPIVQIVEQRMFEEIGIPKKKWRILSRTNIQTRSAIQRPFRLVFG